MKITHASQAKLCKSCERELHSRIQADPEVSPRIIPCRHGAGVVVATVAVRDGRIASWTLYGPLTEEQAAALAERYLQATGAPVEQLVMQ